MLKKTAKILWRGSSHLLVTLLVVLFLLFLSLVFIASSANGSRWLLEKIAKSQKIISYQLVSGTLQDGLELKNFRFTGKNLYLHADTLQLKVTWASLLAGELFVDYLHGDGVRLVLTAPPSQKPVKLKYLNLPIRLILADGVLTHAAIDKRASHTPISRLSLRATWHHTELNAQALEFVHPQFATQLQGILHFDGHYPIQATGQLQAEFWHKQQLKPLKAKVSGDLSALNVELIATKDFPIALQSTVNTIAPDLNYRAFLRWGNIKSPWLATQQIHSRFGQAFITGTKKGLNISLNSDLQSTILPRGNYRTVAETDWHSIHFSPLEARTVLGGKLRVEGDVTWQKALSWKVATRWSSVDLAKKWPQSAMLLAPLTGQLQSTGQAAATGSTVKLTAQWPHQEQWQAQLSSKAWFWQLDKGQHLVFDWRHINRDIKGLGLLQSDIGHLDFTGTPKKYQLQLKTTASTPKTPQGQWQVRGQGNQQQFTFDHLDYRGRAGHLQANGQLSWQQGITWQANTTLDNVQTETWLPNWPAQLTGSTQSTGVWRNNQRQLQFKQTQLQGTLKSLPLQVQGDLNVELQKTGLPHFQAQQLQIDWGKNHLAVEGGLHEQWDATIDSQLTDLSAIDSRLQGQLSGVVVLKGQSKTPAITLNLWAEQLQFQQLGVSSLSMSGTLPELGEGAGFLQVSAKDITVAERVIPTFGLIMEGSRADHQLTWQMLADPVTAEGTLHGSLDNQLNWRGDSQAGTVTVGNFLWQLNAPFAVEWQQAAKQISLAAHCWQAEQAELCSQDTLIASPQAAHAHIALNQLDISRLSAIFPDGLAWQGTLQGSSELNWQAGQQPQIKLELVTDNGAFGLAREDEDPLTLPYHQLRLAANSEDDGNVKFRFDMQAPNMGQGYVEARIKPDEKPYTINGAMVLEQVNLAIFKAFFPAMNRLSGEINLAGGLSGPLTGPDFYGEFKLTDGEITAKNAPIDLTHTNINASIRGKEATITGQLNSGEGLAKIDGNLDWMGEQPTLKLHLQGDNLVLKQKPLFSAKVSPDLNVVVKPYSVDVKGKAKVEDAVLRPQTLSDKAIPLSADVRMIDLEAKDRLKIAKTMRQWDVNADIELLLADNVLFQGFGLNSKLTGSLRLQQQKQRGMQAVGEITLDKEAKYEAYGQNLQIRRGRLLFAGSISQPALDIEAIKSVDSKVVGVRVDGRANAPNLTLFADTAMNQDEMLGYLLLGRPLYQDGQLNTGGGNDGALLASAAIGLGIKGGQGIAGDIGKVFGVKDVTLDAEGSGDDTQFTVSGYLSPSLYLRYGVGVFTPVNKVTLRYKLNQNLYLEAVSSLESALDLFYNFKF